MVVIFLEWLQKKRAFVIFLANGQQFDRLLLKSPYLMSCLLHRQQRQKPYALSRLVHSSYLKYALVYQSPHEVADALIYLIDVVYLFRQQNLTLEFLVD